MKEDNVQDLVNLLSLVLSSGLNRVQLLHLEGTTDVLDQSDRVTQHFLLVDDDERLHACRVTHRFFLLPLI